MGRVIQSTGKKEFDKNIDKFVKQLFGFTSKLWIVGSDDVVRAVVAWQRNIRDTEQQEQEKIEGIVKLAEVLIEMRKDLGSKASEIQPKDLLATFVTDIDQYLPDQA